MQQTFNIKSFSKSVKEKRLELKTGVRELSVKLGIGIATISRIENGKNAEISTLLLMCDWLGLSICSFIKVKK